MRIAAIVRGDASAVRPKANARSTHESTGNCESVRPDAMIRKQPAGVAQLVERQLPKLNVEGSSPFTRFSQSM